MAEKDASKPVEPPKPVHIGGESLVDRLLPHMKQIIIGIVVIAVVLMVVFTIRWLRERKEIAETRKLADTAGREMAAEIATDVLIIEDETFIAMDLESLVKNLGHNVIGVARTHTDAVALAKNKKPGLILADIQLADGSSGLDAVNELLKVFEVPVVFITAYPERFLTGERPEPAFLISKPFQPAMVSAVASQALFFQRNSRNRATRAAVS
jgi:CheY-like chemotaxis protein